MFIKPLIIKPVQTATPLCGRCAQRHDPRFVTCQQFKAAQHPMPHAHCAIDGPCQDCA